MDAGPQMLQDGEALLKVAAAFHDEPGARNPSRHHVMPGRALEVRWMAWHGLKVV
jgi:hypothetical protein